MVKWESIKSPNMRGVVKHTDAGIDVEVVQAYEGLWYLFLTRAGHVVACSIEAHQKASPNVFLAFPEAKKIGSRVAESML